MAAAAGPAIRMLAHPATPATPVTNTRAANSAATVVSTRDWSARAPPRRR